MNGVGNLVNVILNFIYFCLNSILSTLQNVSSYLPQTDAFVPTVMNLIKKSLIIHNQIESSEQYSNKQLSDFPQLRSRITNLAEEILRALVEHLDLGEINLISEAHQKLVFMFLQNLLAKNIQVLKEASLQNSKTLNFVARLLREGFASSLNYIFLCSNGCVTARFLFHSLFIDH